MSPLSNSVYFSVFVYNPYVLNRPYQHLIFVASIGPHQITLVSHNISILLCYFETVLSAHACRKDTSTSHQKQIAAPQKVSWLSDEFSVAFQHYAIR